MLIANCQLFFIFALKITLNNKKMNRIITTIAVAFATFTAVNAQEFKVGAKAGLNLSTLSIPTYSYVEKDGNFLNTESADTKLKAGFHFGGFVEYGFNEKLWVEAGVDYSFQGTKIKSIEYKKIDLTSGHIETGKTELDVSINTQQLNVPLWVKYDIAGFRPKVGVNLGFLTKAEYKGKDENGNSETLSLDPDKTFDFGLGVGAEYNLPFGLFFDATFNLGLSKTSLKSKYEKNGNVTLDFPGMEFKNRVIQIGVGYKF